MGKDFQMKELVCVAPGGSLEIWQNQGHTWRPIFWMEDGTYTINAWLPGNPEFWGREVIGEL